MFNLSLFRVRSPERDQQTDDRRFSRLHRLLAELQREVEHERTGLKARYESAMSDAGFAQWALESDPSSRVLSDRVDTLTDTIMRCFNRLELLKHQLVVLQELDADSKAFLAKTSPATTFPVVSESERRG